AVWHPPRTLPGPSFRSSDNARSVVLELEAAGHHALLTGDLEDDGLFQLKSHALPPLDIILAPHHGGRTANPSWLYDWAKPGLVVVSQRPPAPGTNDPLAALDARQMLLRTWERGAIRLTWTPDGVVARGFRDFQATWDE